MLLSSIIEEYLNQCIEVSLRLSSLKNDIGSLIIIFFLPIMGDNTPAIFKFTPIFEDLIKSFNTINFDSFEISLIFRRLNVVFIIMVAYIWKLLSLLSKRIVIRKELGLLEATLRFLKELIKAIKREIVSLDFLLVR